MSTDERLAQLEQTQRIMVELLRRADERMDTHQDWINQLGTAQAELDAKMAALVDAQISTEDALRELSKAQARTDAQIAETNAQLAKTDAQLAKTDAQLAKTDAQLAQTDAQLAETNAQMAETDARLNRLVETVERYIAERRNGQS